jgi:hypothetical protein
MIATMQHLALANLLGGKQKRAANVRPCIGIMKKPVRLLVNIHSDLSLI